MTQSLVLFDPSNKASQSRSVIRKFADVLTFGGTTALLKAGESNLGINHVKAGVDAIRQTGESAITGSVLGALHGTTGLDKDGIALDLVGGAASSVAGIVAANSEMGRTLRTAGATAVGIFAFRRTSDWMRARRGSHISGFGSDKDPIETAGEAL